MDIQTFPHFLTEEECNLFIDKIRTTHATNFTDSGKFTNKKWTDQELANRFYKRLQSFDSHSNYLRPNNLIMAGLYKSGDSFGIHTDTGLFYDRNLKEKSKWTLLIYLNDTFEGGETVFYHSDNWEEAYRIRPKLGMGLLFDIDLWHSGMPVYNGEKYWIGCEIIGKYK